MKSKRITLRKTPINSCKNITRKKLKKGEKKKKGWKAKSPNNKALYLSKMPGDNTLLLIFQALIQIIQTLER